MMRFLHCTNNFLKPGQPHERLFAAHCVICRVFLFDAPRVVHLFAPRIFMVANVEGVNDFLDVLPYILTITCMGREVVCTLCNCAQ